MFTFISTVALLIYRLLLLLFCFFIIAVNYSKIGCTKLFSHNKALVAFIVGGIKQ